MQRPAAWGSYRVSYTLSKSMNNVGEAFFNGPIDPLDIDSDWGPSDDDQRHRLVVRQRRADATAGALRVHAGRCRTYSALPFNITSGVTTVQGTAGRPIVDGAFIARNAGRRTAFSSVGLRVVPDVHAFSDGLASTLLVEAFNLFNRANETARNTTFGTGAYPSEPLPTFGDITAVGEPRSVQLGVRARF